MTGKLYFQWQNEFLCKTIYPLREKKLRDFLQYFAEIDIWAQYKDKSTQALQAEIEAFHTGQAAIQASAYREYARLRDYFLKLDVRAEYADAFSPLDEAELVKINQLHATFASTFPKLKDVRKEKYFITSFEPAWVERRQEHRRLIAQKKRRIEAIAPEHPNRPRELEQLEQMQTISLPMADTELLRLREFIKAIEKIEARKLELFKSQEGSLRRKDEIERKLPVTQAALKPLQVKFASLQGEVERLKNPPSLEKAQEYFATSDNSAQILQKFPNAQTALLNQVKTLRKAMSDEFGYIHDPNVKLGSLRNHRYNWEQAIKSMEKEAVSIETTLRSMPADWPKRAEREARLSLLRETDMPVLREEISKLNDFYAAFEFQAKPKAELEKILKTKEADLARAQLDLSASQKQVDDMEAEQKKIDEILNVDEERFLTEYVPQGAVTAKDIAKWKVEEYVNSLSTKSHQELLEEIVQRFIKNPERYPLWLQYMVIHFSGMRYKSAHGSWADPCDFLVRWHTLHATKVLEKADDATLDARCQEKLAQYQPNSVAKNTPKLALSADKTWQSKRDIHLQGLKGGPKTRRAALAALQADEIKYDLLQMSESQVLETLVSMKDQFPTWLWKELIALTPLRVNLVNDLGWEKLTPAEEAEKNAYASSDLRLMAGKWKEDHMSGWREEHERSHRLIVSRAVCNETAEHCQHLRGHNPPGGLTAKAPWYLKNEQENKLPGNPRPYFKKPKTREDYTVGASILWLRFVQEEVSPWRVARPLVTKDGDTLMSAELMGRRGKSGEGVWVYQETDMVTRTRATVDANKQKVTQEQWLRWIHEATVAEVGDTAEGPVVLTFETALPDDDPGLSSIGLFRIWMSNALYDGTEDNYNRSFVGFVPEGQWPVEHLEEMLDWNKILRREALPPAELEAWRKKNIRKQ
jgi:hypothetical protein